MTAQRPALTRPQTITTPPQAASDPCRLLRSLLRTARPHQWPKNLLVFAAPLAGATLGAGGHGVFGLLAAFLAFTSASVAVYFVNDVVDAERDRRHPRKRLRPVASGELDAGRALLCAALAAAGAEAAGLVVRDLWFTASVTAYLGCCLLYSLRLKHLPVIELGLLASGFVLRALGGAAAARVAPSGWFVLVCTLGALSVAIAKRYTELVSLGESGAEGHRPSLRWYSARRLRAAGRLAGTAMTAAYLAWALTGPDLWARGWHVASLVPLAAALLRFDRLAGKAGLSRVEDLLMRDRSMLSWEMLWLALFLVGIRL